VSRLTAFSRYLRRDDGFALPEVMVSVIVNLVAVGILAAALVTFSALQQNSVGLTASASQKMTTELRWRVDVRTAAAIQPANSSVVFSTVNAAGSCVTSTWSTPSGAGVVSLNITTATFAGAPGPDGLCTGSVSDSLSSKVIDDVGAGVTFTYTNAVGRDLSFTNGVPILGGSTTAPPGVSSSAWDSTTVGTASVSGEVHVLSKSPVLFAVAQVSSKLLPIEPTSTGSEYVTP
jgi:Tfp pilus assembly protein PilV